MERDITGHTKHIYPIMVSNLRKWMKAILSIVIGDRYFKYNDETVTDVPAEEVLQDRTGSDANPALLCYVRKGKDLVDTLHRHVLETEAEVDQRIDLL